VSFRKYLFLFDIDGTLISPGGVSRGLLAKAVTEKTGEKVHLGYNDVAGYTDRSIVRNALLKMNQTITADLLDRIFQYYFSLMKSEFMVSKNPFVYQDCVDFLDKVQNAGHAVCLLTGNMKAVARIKLEKFDLWKRFDFGVFAEDTEDKLAMPRLAKKRAWEVWKETFTESHMVVVGDTLQDAEAGIKNGCKTVIVCRKREKWDDINKMGPEWLGHCMDTIDLVDLV